MISKPQVTLWAITDLRHEIFETLDLDEEDDVQSADFLASAAGRACYRSFNRPNPSTASTASYIENIIKQQHFSVLAHASATFFIEGVSRSLTHELVRSRFPAFSQESQRYVDSSELDWVCPPAYLNDQDKIESLSHAWVAAIDNYNYLVRQSIDEGATRKRARESARCVIPNMAETKIVMTANMRAWRDFLIQRWSKGADVEIDRLAEVLYRKLYELAPATFSDIVRG